MNSYILEVLANNNQKVYDYIIKWYACVAQGKKNETCLYLKGPEGIGKSTIRVGEKIQHTKKATIYCSGQ